MGRVMSPTPTAAPLPGLVLQQWKPMKFYHGKNTCSLGILVLLEETGIRYDLVAFNLSDGYHKSVDYLSLNPKAKVPMLEVSESVRLTEWPAIAAYLALSYPDRALMSSNPIELARTLEAVDYVVSTIHMQGFSRIVRPGAFAPDESDHAAVIARGREIFEGGLGLMDQGLAGKDFVVGEFSIADAALFYVEDWKARRLGEPLPPRCAAHYARMLDRESVRRALAR